MFVAENGHLKNFPATQPSAVLFQTKLLSPQQFPSEISGCIQSFWAGKIVYRFGEPCMKRMKQRKIFILTRCVAILLFSDDDTEHSIVADAIIPRVTKNGIKLLRLLTLFRNLLTWFIVYVRMPSVTGTILCLSSSGNIFILESTSLAESDMILRPSKWLDTHLPCHIISYLWHL
jgi:hypothetical protein